MNVLKYYLFFLLVGRSSASKSRSIDLPAPTSPERKRPCGESTSTAALWLLRTRTRARLSVPSVCLKKRANKGFYRSEWPLTASRADSLLFARLSACVSCWSQDAKSGGGA